MAGWIDDTDGNINIDFLIGLVIFLGAFMYLIVSIPGIFLPYQTNSMDLGSVVYRTSSILAEDPGWYANNDLGVSGPDWESYSTTDLARVGLAVDKRTPNVLSSEKIQVMGNLPYMVSRDNLGLNNTLTYNYSLKISKILPDGNTEVLLDKSNPFTSATTGNVESIDRMVLIRDGQGLYYDKLTFGNYRMKLPIGREPSFDRTNVTLRLVNFVPTDGSIGDFNVSYYIGPYYDDEDALVGAIPNKEFFIMKNNEYVDAGDMEIYPFNVGDKIDIIIDVRAIAARPEYMSTGFNISRMMVSSTGFSPFPGILYSNDIEDYNTTNPYYRYFDSNGIMTLKVWEV